MINLKNKFVFLTGATGGIGREIAKQLAKEGCNLFLTSTNQKKLSELEDNLYKINKNIIVYSDTADFKKIEDILKVIVNAKATFNSFDILINCAGVYLLDSIVNIPISDFDKSFNINVKAPFIFCKEFAKDMIEKRWGRIINIASTSAYEGSNNSSMYCASKHALLGFSRSLYKELKQFGVRVYCISPAGAKTRMGKQVPNQDYEKFLDPKEIVEYIIFIIKFDDNLITEEIRLHRIAY